MPAIIVLFLAGIAVLIYVLFIMKTAENELIRQFYQQTYGMEVKKETVADLTYGTRNDFVDWLVNRPGMNYVYLEKRLLKKSMRILDKHAKTFKYEDFEEAFREERKSKEG